VPNARHVCELSHSSYFRVGGLRTPAPERAATSSWAGIRNPSHNQTHAPQQIGMLSSSVGGALKEFGLVANRSQPELFAGFPDYSARDRYRSGFVAWPFSPMRHRLIN
jgi:hypothetical protein